MSSTNISRCRSCGQMIVWVRTKSGKNMPCDSQLVTFKSETGGKERIVTEQGNIISGKTGVSREEADGIGYISHFATCPYADEHRKRA